MNLDQLSPRHSDDAAPQAATAPAGALPQGPTAALAHELDSGGLDELIEAAKEHRSRKVADSTKRYHEADWAQFEAWCGMYRRQPLPVDPELVAAYVTDMARQMRPDGTPRYRASSLKRHVSSISRKHYENGGGRGLGEHELIADTLAGIRNWRQERPQRKRPLLLDDIKVLIAALPHDEWPKGVAAARDTFGFLLAFATAMRREEVTGLTVGQVRREPLDGIWVHLGKSKTDQAGEGATLPVPFGNQVATCVPCAWVRWLRLLAAPGRATAMRHVLTTPANPADWAHVCRGPVPDVPEHLPLLRSVTKSGKIVERRLTPEGFNLALKRRAAAAGFDPRDVGAHSLRAGFVTTARRNGADHRAVKLQTRHQSDQMVEVYDRNFNPLDGNAVNTLGL